MILRATWLGWVALLLMAGIANAADTTDADMVGQRRAQDAGRSLIGSPAPGLILKTIDGETIDLSSLYGKKAVYLKFWATWCVPCRQQMPHFEHAFESEGPDLAVIAINVGFNDSVQEIRKYQKQLGITMPIVFDDDGHLGAAFHVRVTPEHIIIGRDGLIQYVGHLADQQLESALLAARAPVADNHKVDARMSASGEINRARHFGVGDKIPVTIVHTLDGRRFQLAKPGFEGPTVLVFMSPWCESYLASTRPAVSANCRTAREQVAALSRGRRARWLEVASGLWAAPEDLKEYRDGYKITLPLTLDESGALFRKFGVSETPTIVILDAKNTVVRRINSAEVATLKQVLPSLM